MDLEQEVKYEMMAMQMTEMADPLQLILLMMDLYVLEDLQHQQINVNNEYQDTIQMKIKINESIYEEMD